MVWRSSGYHSKLELLCWIVTRETKLTGNTLQTHVQSEIVIRVFWSKVLLKTEVKPVMFVKAGLLVIMYKRKLLSKPTHQINLSRLRQRLKEHQTFCQERPPSFTSRGSRQWLIPKFDWSKYKREEQWETVETEKWCKETKKESKGTTMIQRVKLFS